MLIDSIRAQIVSGINWVCANCALNESLKSLSKHRQRDLPAELRLAANWMREQSMKGEQEGLTLQTLELEYRALVFWF